MRSHNQVNELMTRQNQNGSMSNSPSPTDSSKGGLTFIVVAAPIIVLAIVLILTIHRFRRSSQKPGLKPTGYLKRKWRDWKPRTKYGRMSDGIPEPESSQLEEQTAYDPASERHMPAADVGVDRNTSVRSVMTLPAYAPAPRPTERVIGREGERAGMDVVVEFPETAAEEETRREEEMESLYRIRVARRQEIVDREERRRLRREARERGDLITLEELRMQSRLRAESAAAAGGSTTSLGAASMVAEHTARERDRRVSSVSYAELGLARHDGTRLRADSVESDHRPLLDSAASMAGSARGSVFMIPQRTRNRSTSSVLSVSTNASDNDHGHTPHTSTTHGRSASGSDPINTPSASVQDTPPAVGDVDVGDVGIPHPEPPGYDYIGYHGDQRRASEEEEAPPYESPIGSRAPQLPALRTLPAIEVTRSTPSNSVAATPVTTRDEWGGWGGRER